MTLRDEWLKALRSGEYTQAKGALKKSTNKETQYCCLGVLCDVYDEGHWNGDIYTTIDKFGPIACDATPARTIMNEAGLTPMKMSKLIIANDREGKSFKQIADMIENFTA